MQVFLEGQQEPWCKRGKLLLLARQKFGTGVNFLTEGPYLCDHDWDFQQDNVLDQGSC